MNELKIIKEVEKEKMNCDVCYLEGVVMGNGEFISNGKKFFLTKEHKIFKEIKSKIKMKYEKKINQKKTEEKN